MVQPAVGAVVAIIGLVAGGIGLRGSAALASSVRSPAATAQVTRPVAPTPPTPPPSPPYPPAQNEPPAPQPEPQLARIEAQLEAHDQAVEDVKTNKSRAQSALQNADLPVDPSELRALARRLEAADENTSRYETWERQRDELQQKKNAAARHLLELLEARGATKADMSPSDDVMERAMTARSAYVQACRERAEQAKPESTVLIWRPG